MRLRRLILEYSVLLTLFFIGGAVSLFAIISTGTMPAVSLADAPPERPCVPICTRRGPGSDPESGPDSRGPFALDPHGAGPDPEDPMDRAPGMDPDTLAATLDYYMDQHGVRAMSAAHVGVNLCAARVVLPSGCPGGHGASLGAGRDELWGQTQRDFDRMCTALRLVVYRLYVAAAHLSHWTLGAARYWIAYMQAPEHDRLAMRARNGIEAGTMTESAFPPGPWRELRALWREAERIAPDVPWRYEPRALIADPHVSAHSRYDEIVAFDRDVLCATAAPHVYKADVWITYYTIPGCAKRTVRVGDAAVDVQRALAVLAGSDVCAPHPDYAD